jgi:hypothetical protein
MNLSRTHTAQAVITGSYILYLIDGLLTTSDKKLGSTIRLKQSINAKVKGKQYNDYVALSNNAWATVVDMYKDDNLRLAIFQAVETLYYNKFDIMQDFFGESTSATIDRFVMKQTKDGADSSIIKETNMICDSLTKAMDKEIYDYLKG